MQPQSSKFYPNRLTPGLVRVVQWLAPAIAHWFYKIDLVIAPACQGQLPLLKQKRLLLLANHPTFDDPIVLFLISAQVGQPFYYLADLTQLRTKIGPFLQRLGVYSIRRGRPDRDSVRHTLELLAKPDCRLVIFPEGGCSFQNDTVMPFREGAVQMAFQSLSRFSKDNQPVPDLYAVPISIKYRYTQDVQPVIEKMLQQLEKKLEIAPSSDTYQRLRTIGETVLQHCEQEYRSPHSGMGHPSEINDRIAHLKTHLLETLESIFKVKRKTGEDWPDRERVYRLQHLLEEATNTEEEISERSWQDATGKTWTEEQIKKALWRTLNFDAIYDGYVAENPSPERYLDTLTRLEREVFGIDQPIPKGQRQALVWIGEPVNLKEFLSDFERDKTATVQYVTDRLHQTIQTNLIHTNLTTIDQQ
jgi:1-acyl-sn-glycerol-3-phosphate acyltransferase